MSLQISKCSFGQAPPLCAKPWCRRGETGVSSGFFRGIDILDKLMIISLYALKKREAYARA